MKTKNIWALLLITVQFISFGYAQSSLQDSHKKLTEDHTLLYKKHDELNAGSVKDYKKHVDEVGILLENIKKQHVTVEKKQTPKQKESVKANHEAIRKNYASATAHFKVMKEEALKAKPDQNKIKEKSKLLNSQIKEAEKQNLEIMNKEAN